ncbi:hypothetical protein PUN28_014794 [Cardiocondyla obscurior]|uniref:Uncharacterized protein n=1 Tax=Cardiocondyla obscurior TaxID=286306 RepID=A0AAW2EX96_9HYME
MAPVLLINLVLQEGVATLNEISVTGLLLALGFAGVDGRPHLNLSIAGPRRHYRCQPRADRYARFRSSPPFSFCRRLSCLISYPRDPREISMSIDGPAWKKKSPIRDFEAVSSERFLDVSHTFIRRLLDTSNKLVSTASNVCLNFFETSDLYVSQVENSTHKSEVFSERLN